MCVESSKKFSVGENQMESAVLRPGRCGKLTLATLGVDKYNCPPGLSEAIIARSTCRGSLQCSML